MSSEDWCLTFVKQSCSESHLKFLWVLFHGGVFLKGWGIVSLDVISKLSVPPAPFFPVMSRMQSLCHFLIDGLLLRHHYSNAGYWKKGVTLVANPLNDLLFCTH